MKAEIIHLKQLRDSLRTELANLEGMISELRAANAEKDVLVNGYEYIRKITFKIIKLSWNLKRVT